MNPLETERLVDSVEEKPVIASLFPPHTVWMLIALQKKGVELFHGIPYRVKLKRRTRGRRQRQHRRECR